MSTAWSKSFARYIASTGLSFSCANGSDLSTLVTSPIMTFVAAGISTPASFAIVTGFWPTIFALTVPFSLRIILRTLSSSSGLRK